MLCVNFTPSNRLLKDVRASFIKQNTSLNAYCEKNRHVRQNVSSVLSGKWKGPKAKILVQSVLKAAFPETSDDTN